MTTLRGIAHSAHQALSPVAPTQFKHSHVYELLAAAFGFNSWAAMRASHVFIEGDQSPRPAPNLPLIVGRCLQLGYPSAAAKSLASAFLNFVEEAQIETVSLAELEDALIERTDRDNTQSEHDWLDDEDDEPLHTRHRSGATRERLKSSSLVKSQLEQRSHTGDPLAHYYLACILSCKLPPDYLYQESIRGRVLNHQEQKWVDGYLQVLPQHEQFLKHLRIAADAGVRKAALLYSIVANDPSYRLKAEVMKGEVDPVAMASSANSQDSRHEWLWHAVDKGDTEALHSLAAEGDRKAMQCLALAGDERWIRSLIESALEHGDHFSGWMWHYVGIAHGLDSSKSNLHAYHDGGQHDGDFYDSDFGGPMYVDGIEGIELPNLSDTEMAKAHAEAKRLLRNPTK